MAESSHIVIAVDGPSGSGKSTTARLVAESLDLLYLDTGAMYRGITLSCMEKGIAPDSRAELAELLQAVRLDFSTAGRLCIDGKDREEHIRKPEVAEKVSAYSAVPEVRNTLTRLQRELGSKRSCVLDGRDIGTVIFPQADFKFFLVADLRERAKRRLTELMSKGVSATLEDVEANLRERDHQDSTRAVAPLRKADDAVEIDTTSITIKQQVEFIVRRVGVAKRDIHEFSTTPEGGQ